MPESSTPSATEPAVYTGDRARPIAEVKERAARIATGLSELGLAQNDRYCIVMRNEVGFVEATLAGGVIGAVPVPVNWHWTGDDLGHLLRDSEAKGGDRAYRPAAGRRAAQARRHADRRGGSGSRAGRGVLVG